MVGPEFESEAQGIALVLESRTQMVAPALEAQVHVVLVHVFQGAAQKSFLQRILDLSSSTHSFVLFFHGASFDLISIVLSFFKHQIVSLYGLVNDQD